MNTFDVVIKPMERGQITLPQKFRQKLGISKDTLLNIALEDDKLVIIPLKNLIGKLNSSIIKPGISKDKYLEILSKFKGDLWSEKDDIIRTKLKNKEKKLDW